MPDATKPMNDRMRKIQGIADEIGIAIEGIEGSADEITASLLYIACVKAHAAGNDVSVPFSGHLRRMADELIGGTMQ